MFSKHVIPLDGGGWQLPHYGHVMIKVILCPALLTTDRYLDMEMDTTQEYCPVSLFVIVMSGFACSNYHHGMIHDSTIYNTSEDLP